MCSASSLKNIFLISTSFQIYIFKLSFEAVKAEQLQNPANNTAKNKHRTSELQASTGPWVPSPELMSSWATCYPCQDLKLKFPANLVSCIHFSDNFNDRFSASSNSLVLVNFWISAGSVYCWMNIVGDKTSENLEHYLLYQWHITCILSAHCNHT